MSSGAVPQTDMTMRWRCASMAPAVPRAAEPPNYRLPNARARQSVARQLLSWYQRHRRQLPWRTTRDPYAIWVSEMMLQQTQVTTVRDYYERWLERFPDVRSLALAEEQDVLHAWQGLGYYSRARNLLRAAREIQRSHGGALPRSVQGLMQLPGIGQYSAGAIASIAFGVPAPAVDGNVIRVLTRLYALPGDPKKAPLAPLLWQLAEALIPPNAPGDFNQALMELGATVCLPERPACDACPLRRSCRSHRNGTMRNFPELGPSQRVEKQHHIAAVVVRGGKLLMAQLAEHAPRWRGMWQFPCGPLQTNEEPSAAAVRIVRERTGLTAQAGQRLAMLQHSVTRYRIRLEAYWCQRPRGRPRAQADYQRVSWASVDQLDLLALPAAHRRLANAARAGLEATGGSP